MTNKEQWPEGATHKIEDIFTKWIGEAEYSFKYGSWVLDDEPQTIGEYWENSYEIIERPVEPAQYVPEVGEWCEYRLALKGEYRKAVFVGYNEHNEHVIKDVHGDFLEGMCNFRPIKSERDVFIEKSIELTEMATHSAVEAFGIQYDNGARFGNE